MEKYTIFCDLCISTEKNPAKSRSQKDSTALSYYKWLGQKWYRLSECPTNFIDCRITAVKTALVEELSSAVVWLILTCLRKSMSLMLFESLLFLKHRRALWSIKHVPFAVMLSTGDHYATIFDDDFYNEKKLVMVDLFCAFYIL